MTASRTIFIDAHHGSLTAAQFRGLSNAQVGPLIEAWFRARFDICNEEHGHRYFDVGQGPRSAEEIIQTEFGDLISQSVTFILSIKLNQESVEWVPRSAFRTYDVVGPSNDAPLLSIGTDAERAFRDDVRLRLDKLEATLATASKLRGQIGDNHPPDLIDDSDSKDLQDLSGAVAIIRVELAKPIPQSSAVVTATNTAERIKSKIRSALGRKLDLASDEFAKVIGKSAGSLIFWYALYHVLRDAIGVLTHWLQSIGFL